MANRIKELREAKGLLQKDLAELAKVSINTVRRWESGEREPRGKDLLALEAIFETSADYLMGQSDDFIRATAHGRRVSRKMLYVPVLSREMTACCGNGIPAIAPTSEPDEFITWPQDELRVFDDVRPPFAVYVEGDCLESENIRDGDKVVINPAAELTQGSIALVSYHNMCSLKYVYTLRNGDILLQCDNGDVQLSAKEQDESGFSILGIAVACVHRLRKKPLKLHGGQK